MHTSIIHQRVADFLKSHPPFDHLEPEDLLGLAGSGRICFHESEEFVFRQGTARLPFVWVIQQGKVEVLDQGSGGEQLHDLLGEGDLLGLGRLLNSASYLYSARTKSDVILYGLDAAKFESVVARYPSVSQFLHNQLAAIKSYAANGGSSLASVADPAGGKSVETWLDQAPPPSGFLARSLRTMAASEVAALPTVRANSTLERLWMRFLETRAAALRVTEDGSLGAEPVGLLRACDLAVLCGRDPLAIAVAFDTWATGADRPLLIHRAQQLISESFASPREFDRSARLSEALERAAIHNLIRCAAGAIGFDGDWLAFGSMARAEHTVQWTPHIGAVAGASDEGRVSLLARAAAERLPQSSPEPQIRTRQQWTEFYSQLIVNPVLHRIWENRSLLDVRSLDGGSGAADLQALLVKEIAKSKTFVPLLANDTLAQLPPLTFFAEFVVDLEGGMHRTLDLQVATLGPIVDAARVLALSIGKVDHPNTIERLTAVAHAMPEHSGIAVDAAEAFRIACWLKVRYPNIIEPAALDKYDRWLLRRVFAAIQALLELTSERWGLA